MFDPEKLPNKLGAGRDYRGYSQQYMADLLSVHVSSYNKWEKGHNQLNAVVLAQIADILKLSMDFFFTDTEPKNADLNYFEDRNEIKKLADQIKSLESRVSPQVSNSPAVLAVEHNPLIERLVNKVRNLDESVQVRIIDRVDGYIDAIEEIQRGGISTAHSA